MFAPKQYRAKADEYTDLAKATHNPAEVLEFEALRRSFTTLADNEQWLADNYGHTLRAGHAEGTAVASTMDMRGQSADVRSFGVPARLRNQTPLPTELNADLGSVDNIRPFVGVACNAFLEIGR
jgi:hypothetical protein